jgi:hypothetical protein
VIVLIVLVPLRCLSASLVVGLEAGLRPGESRGVHAAASPDTPAMRRLRRSESVDMCVPRLDTGFAASEVRVQS